MTRMLGLDVGERRIGVAISTPEGTLAVPLRIIERTEEADDFRAIAALAANEAIDTVIVGLPRSLDGSLGPQAKLVMAFGNRLAEATGLTVELSDERLTSAGARQPPTKAARKAPSRRASDPVDDLAAAIILQAFLDRRRPEGDGGQPAGGQ